MGSYQRILWLFKLQLDIHRLLVAGDDPGKGVEQVGREEGHEDQQDGSAQHLFPLELHAGNLNRALRDSGERIPQVESCRKDRN